MSEALLLLLKSSKFTIVNDWLDGFKCRRSSLLELKAKVRITAVVFFFF